MAKSFVVLRGHHPKYFHLIISCYIGKSVSLLSWFCTSSEYIVWRSSLSSKECHFVYSQSDQTPSFYIRRFLKWIPIWQLVLMNTCKEYDSGFLKSRYPHWPFHSFSVKRTPWNNCAADFVVWPKLTQNAAGTRNRGENRTLIPLSYRLFAVLKAIAEQWNMECWEFCSSSFGDSSSEILQECRNSSATVRYIFLCSWTSGLSIGS